MSSFEKVMYSSPKGKLYIIVANSFSPELKKDIVTLRDIQTGVCISLSFEVFSKFNKVEEFNVKKISPLSKIFKTKKQVDILIKNRENEK